MTKKHKFLFILWKIKMFFKGLKTDVPVKVWSSEKRKFVKGYIQGLQGDSGTNENFGFYFQVKFLEPIEGNDARFYSLVTYTEKKKKKKKIQKGYGGLKFI